jgi:HSP20 family protein
MKSMVKWDPFRELDLMERGLRRLGMPLMPTVTVPAADIYETDGEFVVELEVPGYDEKELAIEVSDHVLTVKGEHEEATEEKEKTYHLQERLEQEFQRRFELPVTVDTSKLEATFKKGVLKLHAPKAEVTAPKKIPIEA